jgi:branched chain amino acid efflux pump
VVETSSIRDGVRAGLPLALAPLLFGASFGLLAIDGGMGRAGAVAMSATTFAGSAQFAAASIDDDGGGALAAIVAAVLLNARYVPLSLAVAPIFPGSRRRRFLESLLDPEAIGLDAAFPALFLALLAPYLRTRRALATALVAGTITLVLLPGVGAGAAGQWSSPLQPPP